MSRLLVLAIAVSVPLRAVATVGDWPGCDVTSRSEEELSVDCSALALGPEGADGLRQGLHSLSGQTSLTLDVSHNGLGPKGMGALSVSLGALQNLRSLTLRADNNGLGAEGARALGASLQRLGGLEVLSLSVAFDTLGASAGDLVAALGRLPRLADFSLVLRLGHLGSAGSGALGAGLRRLTRLRRLSLDLYGSGVDDAGAADLAAAIGHLDSLHALSLDLRYNAITEGGARDVWASISRLAALPGTEVLGLPLPSAAAPHAGVQDAAGFAPPVAVTQAPALAGFPTPAPIARGVSTTLNGVSVYVPQTPGLVDKAAGIAVKGGGGALTGDDGGNSAQMASGVLATTSAAPPAAARESLSFPKVVGWFGAVAVLVAFAALFMQKWGSSVREYGLGLVEMSQGEGGREAPSGTAYECDNLNDV